MEIEADEILYGEFHDKAEAQKYYARVRFKCSCGRRHQIYTEGFGTLPELLKIPVKGKCGTEVVVIPYK